MTTVPHWSACAAILRDLLQHSPCGVLSDFDGTLSQFTADPAAAMPLPANEAALDALAAQGMSIALISGRATADLRQRLCRPTFQYVGNHGLDYWDGQQVVAVQAAAPWQAAIAALLADLPPFCDPGMLVENKGVTASFHYRAAADPVAASVWLEAQLAPRCQRLGLRLSQGNQIWEVKPPVALHKGTALVDLVARLHLTSLIFLGDDTTDLLAMAALRRLCAERAATTHPLLGIAVGVVQPTGTPPDLYTLCDMIAHGPADVANLLTWLVQELQLINADQQQHEGV